MAMFVHSAATKYKGTGVTVPYKTNLTFMEFCRRVRLGIALHLIILANLMALQDYGQ